MQVVDVFLTTNKVSFVMEFVAGGELFDFIAPHNNLDEMHAAVVMRDLLDSSRIFMPCVSCIAVSSYGICYVEENVGH